MPLSREHILVPILVATCFGTWWVARESAPPPQPRSVDTHRPDYQIDGLRATTLSPSGSPNRRLTAQQMRHYPDDNTSELDHPHLVIIAEDGSRWEIRSEQGRVTPDAEWVRLRGSVRVERVRAPGVEPVELLTEELRLQRETQYAETDQPVRIASVGNWVEAVGLQAWLGEPARIKLLSKVRSYYAFD